MIGLILGIVASLIWVFVFNRIQLSDISTNDIVVVSYQKLKTEYSEFKLRRLFYFPYLVMFGLAQFFYWVIWFYSVIEEIRPNISTSLENNLIGFIFFQSMIININFGKATFGYIFKLFVISRIGLRKTKWKHLNLDPNSSIFYVIGEGVRKIELKVFIVFMLYYLGAHYTLTLIWG